MTAALKLTDKLKSSFFFPKVWRRESTADRDLIIQLARMRNVIRDASDSQDKSFLWYCSQHLEESHSQVFQDLFVLFALGEMKNGFFCEFGATNGLELSNSYMLEQHFGWTGVCAEPARGWHEALRRNRPNTQIETDCVWTETGHKLVFNEVRTKALSTIDSFSQEDGHGRKRKGRRSNTYEVTTISLNDLLAKCNAPSEFEYLSIDTEGSELSILTHLDFRRYSPKVITVEHNFTDNRSGIFRLLTDNGYRRVFEQYSNFDDWYVSDSVTFDAR